MESRHTRAQTIFDNIGDSRDENRSTFLRSQMGKESESDCLLGTVEHSDTDADLNIEKRRC